MLEKNVGAIKNGQSRETGNIGYTKTQDKDNQNNNTTQKTKKLSSSKNVGHHNTQTYTKKDKT